VLDTRKKVDQLLAKPSSTWTDEEKRLISMIKSLK